LGRNGIFFLHYQRDNVYIIFNLLLAEFIPSFCVSVNNTFVMKRKLVIFSIFAGIVLIGLGINLFQWQSIHRPWEAVEEEPEKLTLESAGQIWDYYESIGYTPVALSENNFEVPRIYLDSITNYWVDNQSVDTKKSLFYRTMLPLVLRVNEEIGAERKYLQALAEQYRKGMEPDEVDLAWLRNLARKYKVLEEEDLVLSEELFEEISNRVDTIPVSMALGQMAYESGYATSRFAVEGNALFGQWRWDGNGILPENHREDLGEYRIADFPTIKDSIKAYALNINTHDAYTDFRLARAEQRRTQKDALDVYSLLGTMEFYSEKRQEYIEILQDIIGYNHLTKFDKAKLSPGRPVILTNEKDN